MLNLLDNLIEECTGLARDLRAYVNERRAREQQFPWTLFGAQGTEIKVPAAQPSPLCLHGGPMLTTTGGQQCQLCGKFFPVVNPAG